MPSSTVISRGITTANSTSSVAPLSNHKRAVRDCEPEWGETFQKRIVTLPVLLPYQPMSAETNNRRQRYRYAERNRRSFRVIERYFLPAPAASAQRHDRKHQSPEVQKRLAHSLPPDDFYHRHHPGRDRRDIQQNQKLRGSQ